MTEDLIVLVKEALETDPVLAVSGPAGGKVRVYPGGARLTTDPTPPYIRVCIESAGASMTQYQTVVEVEILALGSEERWKLYRRVMKTLHKQRLAKPGVYMLRLMLRRCMDNVADRVTGLPKLVALFTSPTVINEDLYGA